MRIKTNPPDSLDLASRVADRLGMSWGAFSAMCYQKYPEAAKPIAAYLADPANAADTSPPEIPAPAGPPPVRTVRHCRWCGEEMDVPPPAWYCCPAHKKAMILHKSAVANRTATLRKWVRMGKLSPAFAREELEALECGIRPGKPMTLQHPALIKSLRRACSAKSRRLLGLIKEAPNGSD